MNPFTANTIRKNAKKSSKLPPAHLLPTEKRWSKQGKGERLIIFTPSYIRNLDPVRKAPSAAGQLRLQPKQKQAVVRVSKKPEVKVALNPPPKRCPGVVGLANLSVRDQELIHANMESQTLMEKNSKRLEDQIKLL